MMIANKYEVLEATFKHSTRRYSLANIAQDYLKRKAQQIGFDNYKDVLANILKNPSVYDSLTEAQREYCDLTSFVGIWAATVACVTPYIPLEDWLSMPMSTVEEIATTVQDKNPHWFDTSDQEKKTDMTPPASISE